MFVIRHVMCVVGTRPEIIKMAPVIRALLRKRNCRITLVHSGQHYDLSMSGDFFKELGLLAPHLNIRIGSGTNAEQIAGMLVGYEKAISRFRPDIVLAQGDTNTVLAAGLACMKLGVCFGHVEAGLRSFDRTMPEELNRMVADDCASCCFAPTNRSAQNLIREGIAPRRIFVTGNTIVDVCREQLRRAMSESRILDQLNVRESERLLLVTVHRQENVENPKRLANIFRALATLEEFRVVFPMHPRTRKRLTTTAQQYLRRSPHIVVRAPLGYRDFLRLLNASEAVLTDSGGVQEEALTVGSPCLTLRYSTERPETVEAGGNILVGTEVPLIIKETLRITQDKSFRASLKNVANPLGDGNAGKRIASICVSGSACALDKEPVLYMRDGAATYRLFAIQREGTVGCLRRKHPGISIIQIYDREGNPVFPEDGVRVKNQWHIQAFGQPSLLNRFAQHIGC